MVEPWNTVAVECVHIGQTGKRLVVCNVCWGNISIWVPKPRDSHILSEVSFRIGTNSVAVARRSEAELDCIDTSLMVVRRALGLYCALRPRTGADIEESSYSSSASLEWTLPAVTRVSDCSKHYRELREF